MAVTAAQLANTLPYFPAKDLSAFHVEALLGGGGFAHVVQARDSAGKEWALKLIPAPGASRLDEVDGVPLLLTEARIHLLLSGEPSVLPCLEAFKSVYVNERGGGGQTYMAVLRMPVAACSVEEWLFTASPAPQACQGAPASQVEEEEVLCVWLQMANAVHRCHAHGIIHKDIKLPNFLMDGRGKVQIMDFGLAQVEGVTPRAVVGTPWTMSPAGLKHGDDGRAGDWWALGVVLYQLLQGGAWPFKHCWWPWQKGGGERMEAAIRRAVLAGRITFQGGAARVSEPLRALIRGLLQPDPNRRWQLRQVLAAEAVRPELLARLGQRFPELEPDMQALLQLQRRARDVQALGSDGGIAAGGGGGAAAAASLATAGSVLVAAASTVLRGGVSVVVEGALHWPHWPGGGRGGEPGAGGGDGDGSSYRPLLDVEDQEAPAAAAAGEELPARSGGPSALLTAPATEARPSQQQQQHAQQPKQQKSTGAPVADLLLLFPNELPDAHPPPPGSLRVYPPLPPTANTGGAGAAAAALSPVGLAPTASVFSGDQEPLASGRTLSGGAAAGLISTTSSGAVGAAGIHHALTTTSLNARADAGSDIAARGPSDASGPASGGDGPDGRRQPGSHPHSLRLSRRSLTGSPLRGTSQLGAPPHSPSPRSRRSRTSLHDLFGAPCASLQLQGPPSLLPQPHQRPPSGPGLGGLLGTATEYLSGGGAASGGHHPRGSWTLPRRSPPLLEPLDAGAEGEEAEQAAILPQSSWVPPPPEAIAAAAAAAAAADAASRRGDGSGTARLAAAGRAAAAGTGSGPGAVAPQGSGGDPHAQPHLHSHQHQHQQHQQQRHHRHSGLIARARRLFADCLLRPGGKYDMYECDEYDTLPEPAPVPGKAQ